MSSPSSSVPPRSRIRTLLTEKPLGAPVCVLGWVRTRRDSKGGLSFLELNDGSCQANLQAVLDASTRRDEGGLYQGVSVEVVGEVVASTGSKQPVELKAAEVRILGAVDPLAYPIGKQKMSYEYLRDFAHLRVRTNTFGAVARVRNTLAMGVHEFFQQRGFFYVHTPILTASDAEGAGKTFQVTTLDLEKLPREGKGDIDYGRDFFGTRTSLTVSGQLQGEAYACGLGDIYTFGPTFRAENSQTSRHLAEFWMIEPEMAFADLEEDARLAEDFLKELLGKVLDRCPAEMDFFRQRVDAEIVNTLENVVNTTFQRLTYTEAVSLLQKSGEEFRFPVEWGADLQSEHERYLTEKEFRRPVILTDYPKEIKAFYMKLNEDGKTVRAMDVLLPKIGEIIGGSQREDRADILEAKMRAAGIDPASLSWYLDLRRFGSVPHAGFGLGFERLVQFATGMANIRDVIPFPRTPGHIAY